MKLAILAVSHRQPDWVQAGCEEYLKRMPKEMGVRFVAVKPEARSVQSRSAQSCGKILSAEKTRILQAWDALGGKYRLVALDERGMDLTTRQLAQFMESRMREGQNLAFLVGGADGLDVELKQKADALIRLSSLTLPHGLARLLLCEQLYRAVSLLNNHPYHRE